MILSVLNTLFVQNALSLTCTLLIEISLFFLTSTTSTSCMTFFNSGIQQDNMSLSSLFPKVFWVYNIHVHNINICSKQYKYIILSLFPSSNTFILLCRNINKQRHQEKAIWKNKKQPSSDPFRERHYSKVENFVCGDQG